MRQIHALTPGDHFSPHTGSAIPTVVHGLCRHAKERPAVLVARGTYADRYDSADIIEYPMTASMHGATLARRLYDAAIGRAGRPRPWASSVLRQPLVEQEQWDSAHIVAHNSPQLVPLVAARHDAVLHVHSDLLGSYSRRETSRTLASVHRIVCVSDWLADRTSDQLPASLRARVRVVHNGVDNAAFRAVSRTSRSDVLRVAFLGRVVPLKGPDVLLRAVGSLERSDVHVTLVGSAGFDNSAPLSRFESELRRLGEDVPGGVTFLPFQDRESVARLMAQVDVCVVPSTGPEAFGLVALEAMAAGTAVIVSRSGGLPEAVGEAGVIVGRGDVTELAGAIESFADDESEVARCAEAGLERARAMDWSVVAPRYEAALA